MQSRHVGVETNFCGIKVISLHATVIIFPGSDAHRGFQDKIEEIILMIFA